MIISGTKIKQEIQSKRIIIDPFFERDINPASIDLRLGNRVIQYAPDVLLDPFKENKTLEYEFNHKIVLQPGQLYIMHTVNRVCTDNYVQIIDGKSTLGRLGLTIHVTAGYGDPGFCGQYTLEVTCVRPIVLYENMRICQVRFQEIKGKTILYSNNGRYVGGKANGPVSAIPLKKDQPNLK